MSESQEPGTTGVPTRADGDSGDGGVTYSRSSGGLIGAMVVTVLAVLAFAAFRATTRDNAPTPIQTVDYAATVRVARADKQLLVMAPVQLPAGWKATSATYTNGPNPAWHLGTLTDTRKYVGVEESRTSIQDLADAKVDPDARQGRDVTIAGRTWQTFTDRGGDYAVARSQRSGGATGESWLVVGTAPHDQIRAFAATLKGGALRPAR
jgi:hypothetical protein